jgi:hypothetical protein
LIDTGMDCRAVKLNSMSLKKKGICLMNFH